jgi:DNA polymerase (family 10)
MLLNDEGILVLKSSEVDILADGRLDLQEATLKRLDFTVCTVHYKFDLDAKAQTGRVLRAMDNRYLTILAIPRAAAGQAPSLFDRSWAHYGRGERARLLPGAECASGTSRSRRYPLRAGEGDGVKLAISTDAHSTTGLGAMRFGFGQVRRGWLEAGDILNTRPWPQVKRLFAG